MSDVKMTVVNADAQTTTGTFSYTESGFGNPAGGLFFYSGALTKGTNQAHARFGIGAFDASGNQRAIGCSSQDNLATSVTARTGTNSDVMVLLANNGASITGEAAFDSIVTDGVQVDYTDAFPNTQQTFCAMFGGADMECSVGNISSNATSGSTVTISSLSFPPTAIVLFGNKTAFPATPSTATDARMFIGFACIDESGTITQGSQNWMEVNNVGAGSKRVVIKNSDLYAISALIDSGASNISDGAIEVTDFGTDSIELTTRLDSVAQNVGYLVLGGGRFYIERVDAPTTVSTQANTGAGFEPASMIQVSGRNDGTMENIISSVRASSVGFGAFGLTSTKEGSAAISAQYKTGNTNTFSVAQSSGMYTPNHSASDYMEAKCDDGTGSWDADGWTLNFTNVLTAGFNHVLYMALKQVVTPDLAKEVADVLNIQDEDVVARALNRAEDEVLNLGDEDVVARALNRAEDETLNLQDEDLVARALNRATDETLNFGEEVAKLLATVSVVILKAVDEAFHIEDSADRARALRRAVESAMNLAEDVAEQPGFVRAVDATLSIDETVEKLMGLMAQYSQARDTGAAGAKAIDSGFAGPAAMHDPGAI